MVRKDTFLDVLSLKSSLHYHLVANLKLSTRHLYLKAVTYQLPIILGWSKPVIYCLIKMPGLELQFAQTFPAQYSILDERTDKRFLLIWNSECTFILKHNNNQPIPDYDL